MKILFLTIILTSVTMASKNDINENLRNYLTQRVKEFDQIDNQRKIQLKELAELIQTEMKSSGGKQLKITFICTHNSRRSHLGQLFAIAGADYYDITGISRFSGGTEATAFNPRAVAALERAGFIIENPGGENPHYKVGFRTDKSNIQECFSKVYSDKFNPQEDFIAVMVCSQADEECPFVLGADHKFSLPYDDPKAFDGTKQESEKYDERTQQISRELLYMWSLIKD